MRLYSANPLENRRLTTDGPPSCETGPTGTRDREIGHARVRSEDTRLLTGRGHYASDTFPEDHVHAVLVRAPVAHARISRIDTAAAANAQDVVLVLTGDDAAADGLRQPIPHNPDWRGPPDAVLQLPDGFDVFLTEHLPLSASHVRHVGEPVALVIAQSRSAAADAAQLVEVDYEELPHVVDARAAMRADAPSVWSARPDNIALTCEVGDSAATEAAFASAAHVVRLDTWVHRVTGSPMEPRAVVGEYDPQTERYTLRAASGRGVVQTRDRLATTLGVDPERCRVVFGDMGGNFGTRNAFTPEFTLMPWAARRVGRPVKWVADRDECFLTDYQARDTAFEAELALDADGNIVAMRGTNTMNLGAYTVYFWPLRKGLSMMQGVYRVPTAHFRGHAVLTNTAPTAVYRSAGRPEAIFVIERLLDLAAAQCGFDRVELRSRNLIQPDAMPFENAVGVTYDSGDYPDCMRQALELADWSGYPRRKQESVARGRRRGISIANYIEVTSGIPRERVELHVLNDGTVEFVVGTMSSGQGHETSFPQLAADWLEIPFSQVRFVANDTERVSVGGGSHSGRSMRLVSIAARDAVDTLLRRGKAIAAHQLQTSPDAIVYAHGQFSTTSGASISLAEVATSASGLRSLPEALSGPFCGIGDITNRAGGYPYGAHVCEVEVDPDTGAVEIVNWACVDDVGLAVNPLILHGQAHGATTQGIGQAMLEAVVYEPDNAQLLTGSYMDYAMPRAMTTPTFKTAISEVPATSHPEGIRPGGEGGTTPALGAAINAIVDALRDDGVEHIEMPATPERVWQAIRAARRSCGTPEGPTP